MAHTETWTARDIRIRAAGRGTSVSNVFGNTGHMQGRT